MNEPLKINNNKTVSINELNQVLVNLKDDHHSEKEIYFINPINKIDIVFIAGLILFHIENKTMYKIEYKGAVFNRIFEVRLYLKQFQELFNLKWTDVFSSFKGISTITDSDYFASESYAPIMFISKDTIDKLFKEHDEDKIGSNLFDMFQKYINEKIKAKNRKEEKYLNSVKSIKTILSSYPPIFTFAFAVLYNKIAPFVKSSEKENDKASQRTEQLWEFTKEYIKGLRELAKNIVEHSNKGEGMITLRAYDDSEKAEMLNSKKILETHVFDFGTQGIVSKLIEDTQKNLGKNKVYADDLEILNHTFSMGNFIKPTVKTKLNQQLYRDIAHYGLMKFYKLIEKNDGIVVSSSKGKTVDRDIFSTSKSHNSKAIIIGTSFFFQLPFKYELFKSIDSASSTGGMQGSPQIINGLSELMNINEVSNLKEYEEKKSIGGKILFHFKPKIEINNRDDEVSLFKPFTELVQANTTTYIAVDMRKINISSSSLLRFLSHLSNRYSHLIIIYNLDFELYDELIEDNKQFYQTLKDLEEGIPYWYDGKGILVFSKIEEINFNFADIIYGKNEKAFQTINHLVSHTFPNTLSIIQNDSANSEDFKIPNCLSAFFYQSSLLPFDLLLFNIEKKTLFHSNLETLLCQELHESN